MLCCRALGCALQVSLHPTFVAVVWGMLPGASLQRFVSTVLWPLWPCCRGSACTPVSTLWFGALGRTLQVCLQPSYDSVLTASVDMLLGPPCSPVLLLWCVALGRTVQYGLLPTCMLCQNFLRVCCCR